MTTVGWYDSICIAEQDNKDKVRSAELLERGQWFGVWTATSKKFQKSAKQESTEKYNKTPFYNISIWYVLSIPSFIYSNCLKITGGVYKLQSYVYQTCI